MLKEWVWKVCKELMWLFAYLCYAKILKCKKYKTFREWMQKTLIEDYQCLKSISTILINSLMYLGFLTASKSYAVRKLLSSCHLTFSWMNFLFSQLQVTTHLFLLQTACYLYWFFFSFFSLVNLYSRLKLNFIFSLVFFFAHKMYFSMQCEGLNYFFALEISFIS